MTRRGRRPRGGADRGPRPLGESLDDVVSSFTPPRPGDRAPEDEPAQASAARGVPGPRPGAAAAMGTVFATWGQIVGPAVARHTRPLRLEGGTLVVAVDQPPWATEMRVLAPGILTRLTEQTGERLDRLEVVVRPLR
jgi:hypothetical protein